MERPRSCRRASSWARSLYTRYAPACVNSARRLQTATDRGTTELLRMRPDESEFDYGLTQSLSSRKTLGMQLTAKYASTMKTTGLLVVIRTKDQSEATSAHISVIGPDAPITRILRNTIEWSSRTPLPPSRRVTERRETALSGASTRILSEVV